MPFKSEAQRRKFYAMAETGEVSEHTLKKWEKETPDKKLPEHVKKSYYQDGQHDALTQLGLKSGE